MTKTRFSYSPAAELPSLGHFYEVDGTLIDFSSGFTFTLTVKTRDLVTTMFTKTTNITGAAGAGSYPSGTPNITVAWATTAELSTLTAGTVYACSLVPRRTSDSKDYDAWDFEIHIRSA